MSKIFSLSIFVCVSLLAITQANGMFNMFKSRQANVMFNMFKSANVMFNRFKSRQANGMFNMFKSRPGFDKFIAYCGSLDADEKKRLASLLSTMDDREHRYCDDYLVFYHGATINFYEYLLVNKLLMAKKNGRKPDDFEFLRAPGTRRKITRITLIDYVHKLCSRLTDTDPKVHEQLLSVSYSPFATELEESAGYFFIQNRSIDYWHNEQILRLVHAFGFESQRFPVVFPKRRTRFGIMLQIFIKKGMVDELAYDSRAFGFFHGSVSEDKNPFGQARILLRPQFFDHSNDNVKIFAYIAATEEEQHKLCDKAQHYVDSLKPYSFIQRFCHAIGYGKGDVERIAFQPA